MTSTLSRKHLNDKRVLHSLAK